MNRTFGELYDFCLRSGWGDISEKGIQLLKVRINTTLQHLARMRPWSFYRTLGVLQLIAPNTTGTATATEGSAAVVGVGTAFAAGMVGQRILFGSDDREYEISAVASATGLTLAENYLGTTAALKTLSVRYVRYAVPDRFDRAGRMYHRLMGWMLDGRDLADFLARRLNVHQESQAPDTVWKTDDYFYVDPAPSAADSIHYPYWQRPARLVVTDDVTDWPEKFDWLLFAALAETVRQRTEQAAMAALYAPAFQEFAATAFNQADASAEPIQLSAGRAPAGRTLQQFQAAFTVAPDV